MRLIDADAFEVFRFTRKSEDFADGVLYVLDKIDEAPTVDAVAVVRCRNCIHLFSIIFGSYCQLLGKQMDKDDYCSFGERREDDAKID